jgi:hypothetical protein
VSASLPRSGLEVPGGWMDTWQNNPWLFASRAHYSHVSEGVNGIANMEAFAIAIRLSG